MVTTGVGRQLCIINGSTGWRVKTSWELRFSCSISGLSIKKKDVQHTGAKSHEARSRTSGRAKLDLGMKENIFQPPDLLLLMAANPARNNQVSLNGTHFLWGAFCCARGKIHPLSGDKSAQFAVACHLIPLPGEVARWGLMTSIRVGSAELDPWKSGVKFPFLYLHFVIFWGRYWYMGASKNRGKTSKMDGENNGNPYEQIDDLGVPLFLETPI